MKDCDLDIDQEKIESMMEVCKVSKEDYKDAKMCDEFIRKIKSDIHSLLNILLGCGFIKAADAIKLRPILIELFEAGFSDYADSNALANVEETITAYERQNPESY